MHAYAIVTNAPIAPIIFDREQNENRTFSYFDDLYAFKDAHDGKVPVDFSSFVLLRNRNM